MVIDFVPAYYQNFELIALMKSVQPQLTMVTDFELTVLMKSEKQIHEKQEYFCNLECFSVSQKAVGRVKAFAMQCYVMKYLNIKSSLLSHSFINSASANFCI